MPDPVHAVGAAPVPASLAAVQLPELSSFDGEGGRPLKRRMLFKLQPLLEVAGASVQHCRGLCAPLHALPGYSAHFKSHMAGSTACGCIKVLVGGTPCHLPLTLSPALHVPLLPVAADFEFDVLRSWGEDECRHVYSSILRDFRLPDGAARVLEFTRVT